MDEIATLVRDISENLDVEVDTTTPSMQSLTNLVNALQVNASSFTYTPTLRCAPSMQFPDEVENRMPSNLHASIRLTVANIIHRELVNFELEETNRNLKMQIRNIVQGEQVRPPPLPQGKIAEPRERQSPPDHVTSLTRALRAAELERLKQEALELAANLELLLEDFAEELKVWGANTTCGPSEVIPGEKLRDMLQLVSSVTGCMRDEHQCRQQATPTAVLQAPASQSAKVPLSEIAAYWGVPREPEYHGRTEPQDRLQVVELSRRSESGDTLAAINCFSQLSKLAAAAKAA